MNQAQDAVTGRYIIDQHSDGADIEQLVKIEALTLHFFPDAVDVFRSPKHLAFDAGFRQRILQAANEFMDKPLPIRAAL